MFHHLWKWRNRLVASSAEGKHIIVLDQDGCQFIDVWGQVLCCGNPEERVKVHEWGDSAVCVCSYSCSFEFWIMQSSLGLKVEWILQRKFVFIYVCCFFLLMFAGLFLRWCYRMIFIENRRTDYGSGKTPLHVGECLDWVAHHSVTKIFNQICQEIIHKSRLKDS